MAVSSALFMHRYWIDLVADEGTVSPLSLLQNPMILIAIVGLGVVIGMPYLLDNSMSTSPSYLNKLADQSCSGP